MTVSWCGDPAAAVSLADFFVRHVDPDYISHGELQLGRAIDPDRWSPDLARLVGSEIQEAVENGAESRRRVVTAYLGQELVGLALVSLHGNPGYGILEDLLVDKSLRREGIGDAVLNWIEKEIHTLGCRRMFLESGIRNHDAHHFFERRGFSPCSVVMMKPVGA